MKKNIYLIIFFLSLIGLWKYSQTALSDVKNSKYEEKIIQTASADIILERDQQKLEQNIKPTSLENANWADVNNYSKSAKSIVNKKNAKDYFLLASSTVADLAACLKKDYCGMEKRNENDAYFDESRTPGHILLGRNLEFLLESLNLNPDLSKEMDWDMIEELTESENDKIQVQAIELLKKYNEKNNETEKLLKIADTYKGNAKADALASLSSRSSRKDRQNISNAIEKSFAEDDPNTVISIVEKLKKMRLSEAQVLQVSRNLCHFKEDGSDDHNWKMLKYDMKGITDLDKLCD